MADFTNLCHKCTHYSYCKVACPFAQLHANQETFYSKESYEENPAQPGSYHYVLRPTRLKDIHISQLGSINNDGEVEPVEETRVFDTDDYREFWNNIDYKTRRIELISDVLFDRLTYAEIADKHGYKDATTAQKTFYHYMQSLARRASLLEQEDQRIKSIKRAKEELANNNGRMNRDLKIFLCHHCLNMTTNEILNLFKTGRSTVYRAFRKYKQLMQKGELKLVYDKNGYIVEESRKTSKPRKNRTAHEVQLQE